MLKDFNQSTSLESYLKLQWVYSNTSTIIIRTLYVSNINTDCVQLFDSLFHTPPRANYNNSRTKLAALYSATKSLQNSCTAKLQLFGSLLEAKQQLHSS